MALEKITDSTQKAVNVGSVSDRINTDLSKQFSGVAAPSFGVYTPDYGALDKSFQSILGSFQQYKDAAQAGYEAQKGALDTSLERNIQEITQAKEDTKQGFGEARSQLSEDIFMADRRMKQAMSARGLAGSGVEAMNTIQNRMAAGDSLKDIANDYFDTQEKLTQAEVNARQDYNNSLQTLNASLQQAIATITSQEASAKMDYAQTVEALKRQVIADTSAASQAQAQWQLAQDELLRSQQVHASDIQAILESGQSDAYIASALKTLGVEDREIDRLMSEQKATTTKNIQNQINSILQYSENPDDDVANLMAQLAASGYDTGLLNPEGTYNTATTAKTTTSTSPASQLIMGPLGGLGKTIGNIINPAYNVNMAEKIKK